MNIRAEIRLRNELPSSKGEIRLLFSLIPCIVVLKQ